MRTHLSTYINYDTFYRSRRIYSTIRTIRLVRAGVVAPNPVSAFIEACTSLADAAQSAFSYFAIKEEIKQVLIEIDLIKRALIDMKIKNSIKLKEFEARLGKDQAELEIAKTIFNSTCDHLHELTKMVLRQRARYPKSKETKAIEDAYLYAIIAKAQVALLFISKNI